MANQMIALGVRAPQMPDLGRATQQFGAMLSTAAQQRASQRQAEQAEQAMAIARAQEQRATEQHVTKQEIDRYAFLRNLYPTVNDDAGHQAWLRAVADASPQAAQVLQQVAPTYSPENRVRLLATADEMINLLASARQSVVNVGPNGEIFITEFGGVPEGQGTFPSPMYQPIPQGGEGAAPETPTAPAATPTARAPARGAEPTPQDLMDQGIPESAIPMGSPLMRPVSAGGMAASAAPVELTMETAPQIIQNAVQNRVIDQTHLQQLRSMVGPDNERSLASWMQQNQIRIQPTGEAPISPGMRTAEYRPGMDAAPQFRQVQAVTGPGGRAYVPTGEVARARPPLVSPSQEPATAGAVAEAQREPIGSAATRAGATTRAERVAEAETIYDRTRRERQAQNDATFVETYPSSSTTVRDGLRVFDRLIGDARVRNGSVVVPSGGRRPHPGFEGLVGLGIPGMRFIPGSREADADALFRQIQGKAFLEAFETLKGGGQITEREGQVATEAMSRLGRNISEAEFIEAANELRAIMRNSLARADRRAQRLGLNVTTGSAPETPRRTPTRRAPTRTRGGAAVSNW